MQCRLPISPMLSVALLGAPFLARATALPAVPAAEAVAAPVPALAAHPNSFSSSRLVVTLAAVRLELHCQAQSLLEVFGPDVDPDGDGFFDDAELAALADPLQAYVNSHYVLRADSGGDGTRGVVLPGMLVELSAGRPELDAAYPTQWVDMVFEARAADVILDLLIDATLFQESAPDHRDLCQLEWNGGEPRETLFWMGEYRRYFAPDAPPEPRPLLGWVRMGIGHILSGYDHIAFLLVLIVAAGSWRGLLGVVTAFTLAHSVTLALAALDLVRVNGRLVELVIAASIAWVAAANLRARVPRARWREAFVFGLVHGLGFAGFVAAALYGEPQRLRPLVGFNLGVECGQLAVVLAVVAALGVLRRVSRAPAEVDDGAGRWLAPRAVRVGISGGVCLLALFWICERAGWIARTG